MSGPDPFTVFPGGAMMPPDQYQINSIMDVSPMFLGDLGAYFAANLGQIIPNIDQVPGFVANTPYTATTIQTEETTTSTTYTNLTTTGPSLTSLPDGTYMVAWGAIAQSSTAATRAIMGMSANGAAADDTMRAQTNATNLVGVSFITAIRLNAGSGGNSLTAKYRIGASGAKATFGSRYLSAIRVTGA